MNTTQNQDPGHEGRVGSSNSQAGSDDAIRQGAQELKHGTEELRNKATEVAKEATREGQAQVDQYRNVAAQKVDTIAESVKAAAAKLQEGDVGQWSSQIAGMADSMTRFSQGLREKSADEVMHDMNRLARENPAIFVGGAVAIGFGLTRLMRATAQPRPAKETHRADDAPGMSSDQPGSNAAYTSRTITGSGDQPQAGSSRGASAYGAGFMGSGGATAGQPDQSGFSGTGGSQGNGNLRSDQNRHDDNDRSTSS